MASSLGSLSLLLEADSAKLESDLGKAASIADARSKEMARSFSVVQKALADQKGVSKDVLQPYIQQLDTATRKQKEASHAVEEFGFHTAGAKRELLVLAHELSQGNFSRFGGSLLVLGERTGAASLLFSKAALAAGGLAVAVIAVATAIAQGTNEATQYAKALTLTGNYLGQTTGQLAAMALAISKTTGTQGQAAEALAALANSGKVASGSLVDVGAAVVSMNRVLGVEIEKGVEMFSKLAEEPAKASLKLNETMHYLTLATYERIRALEEQGQKEEAAALAQTTYATATNTRLASVEAQAGVLTKAWRALAHDAKEAWDMMQGLGRPKSTSEMLADAQQALADKLQRGPLNSLTGDSYAKGVAKLQAVVTDLTKKGFREQENAYAEGEKVRVEAAKIAASDRLSVLSKEIQTNADKRKKAIEDLNRDYKTLGKATSGPEYDAMVAKINERFKDPKGAAPKAYHDDAATKYLETLRQTEASLQAQLAGEDKLTEAQKEQAKFQQLIADLKGKAILTAEQKSLLAAAGQINAQLALNVALDEQIEKKKAAVKLAEREASYAKQLEAITMSYQTANANRSEQYDRTLSTIGLGDRARKDVEAQKAIYKEFNQYKLTLDKETANASTKDFDAFGTDEYKKKVEELKGALEDQLAAQQAFFDADKAARLDWSNGAKTALANYIDEVEDAAKRANELATTALSGFTDSITKAIMGEKGTSFKDLGKSIAAQIVHGIVETQITAPIAKWLQDSLMQSTSGGGGASGLMGILGQLLGSTGGGLAGGAASTGLASATAADVASAGPGLMFFADGGSPPLNVPSVVGEKGPELFVPTSAGTIYPNSALQGLGSGGGGRTTTVNLTMNVPKGTDTRTAGQWGAEAARQFRTHEMRNS
jgi:lambda family phage tail tape measure protein